MSDVYSAIPQKTESAAGLAGDQGGFCGVGAGAPAAGLGLLGLMAAGLRRRRGAAGAALALGAAILPATASAAADRPKKSSDVELRYGRVLVSDESIQSVYGDDGNCDTCTDRFGMLYLEGGRQFGRLLELDGGVGLLQKQGSLVGVDTGEASDDLGRLMLAPVTASATLRLEVFREQILVPFGRVGADYWLWRERALTYSAADGSYSAADALGGGKPGYHYGFGVDVLLDRFDPSAASEAEARWGIHDTYMVIEWRTNEMLGEVSGLSFAGDALSVGLKIDR